MTARGVVVWVLALMGCGGTSPNVCGISDADGGVVPCGGSAGASSETSIAGENPGLGFAGVPSSGGSSLQGGTGGVSTSGGASSAIGGTAPMGSEPYVVYVGPSQSLGLVGCSYWYGADYSNPNDPLMSIPEYGYYEACNPTSTTVKDFWLRFAVQPFYPSGDSTHAYAFDYFWNGYLYLSNLAKGQSVSLGLDGMSADTRFPGEGTAWAHFTGSQIPAFIIPANSCVQMRLASTLCPRVKVIPNPGDPEYIYPPVGTVVSLKIGTYKFGENPMKEIAGPWNSNTFGGIED